MKRGKDCRKKILFLIVHLMQVIQQVLFLNLLLSVLRLNVALFAEDSLWNCKGYTLFGNRKYWCARRSGHGEISIKKAVAESCNTLFFEIGKKIDIDVLAEYAL